jgi:tetratricopeptide (TPR) repeat protein
MAKISLRAYFKKIDKMIDSGDNDEAVEHSRYLLNLYPKCVDAYRGLAKALLEKKSNSEARDIFNRVLAVYPDDFISHVGLSIIYENEGNLDASIWHMELAYDMEPSNPVLTEELRRLFARRDGVQPPKIRMTRGALIRMYARGELYQQAISECQGVLKEDPRRLDIQLIMAQMQYILGSLLESSAVCSKILEESPYCFDANRLLIEIIPRTSQNIGVTLYKSRLEEVDPYYKFVTSPEMNSSDIPEDAIVVEFLDVDNTPVPSANSNWIKSNFTWNEPQRNPAPGSDTHPLPSLPPENPEQTSATLSGVTPLSPGSEELEKSHDEFIKREMDSLDNETNATYNERELPDWLLKAGWQPSKGANSEELDNSTPKAENDKVEPQLAESAVLPEWLNAAQPPREFAHRDEETNEPNQASVSEEPIANLTYDDESLKREVVSKSESLVEAPENQTQIPAQGEAGEQMTTDSNNRNEDEWLNQLRNDPVQKGDQNDLPDWLKDFESENEQPLEGNMDIPEWLKSLEPAEPAETVSPENKPPEASAFTPEAEKTPEEPQPAVTGTSYVFTKMLSESEARDSNLKPETQNAEPYQTAPTEPAAQGVPEPVQPAPSSGLPAWVRNILKQPASTPPAPAEPAPVEALRAEEPLTVEEVTPPSPAEPVQPPLPKETVATPAAESLPSEPAALGEEPIHELPAEVPAEGAISSDTSSELLDWLRGLGETEEQPSETVPAAEEIPAVPEETSLEEEPADRLGSFIETSEVVSPPSLVEPIAEVKPEMEPTPEPVSPIPGQIGSETISSAPVTAWVEEVAHEEEAPVGEEVQAVEAAAENVIVPSEEGEITPEVPPEEPMPVFEEPVFTEAAAGSEAEVPAAEIPETKPMGALQAEVAEPVPDFLFAANEALNTGDFSSAMDFYNQALQDEARLPGLIESLKSATTWHGENTDLWQLLGDAYARTSQFGDAFAAYDKAEAALLKSYPA